MLSLTAEESRVLGVLIEKAATTPEQYPLSLSAAVSGSNQKSNRDPVFALTEEQCFDALESLRAKGLVVRVDMPGNRVHKYRHAAGDVLRARAGELAVLAELLLRGPQTLGELRGRADRMAPMESIETVQGYLSALSQRPEPLVHISAVPGSRAPRYVQLLSPQAQRIEESESGASRQPAAPVVSQIDPAAGAAGPPLAQRVEQLEAQVAALTAALRKLAGDLGEADPLATSAPADGDHPA